MGVGGIEIVVSVEVSATAELHRPIVITTVIAQDVIAKKVGGRVEVPENESITSPLLQVFHGSVNACRELLLDGHAPVQKSWLAQKPLIHCKTRHQRRTG